MLGQTTQTTLATTAAPPLDGGLRKLPEDPLELDSALKPFRTMVAPLVSGVSRVFVELEAEPLDAEEKEGGKLALAALMYQYGGQLDARLLVAMWIAGVALPRAPAIIKSFKKTPETSVEKMAAKAEAIRSADAAPKAA